MDSVIRDFIAFLHFKRTERLDMKVIVMMENDGSEQDVEICLKNAWLQLTQAKKEDFLSQARAHNQNELRTYWGEEEYLKIGQPEGQELSAWPPILPLPIQDGVLQRPNPANAVVLNLRDLMEMVQDSHIVNFFLICKSEAENLELLQFLSDEAKHPNPERTYSSYEWVRVQVYLTIAPSA